MFVAKLKDGKFAYLGSMGAGLDQSGNMVSHIDKPSSTAVELVAIIWSLAFLIAL